MLSDDMLSVFFSWTLHTIFKLPLTCVNSRVVETLSLKLFSAHPESCQGRPDCDRRRPGSGQERPPAWTRSGRLPGSAVCSPCIVQKTIIEKGYKRKKTPVWSCEKLCEMENSCTRVIYIWLQFFFFSYILRFLCTCTEKKVVLFEKIILL
jgi:hypothetical protein